ncbi:MAG: protein serine/threonine phosphatase with Cache sensor [Chthoniobacter sp.]|nr:protein serine/threonine phosphatase with Cache sensor [Chthoniobacter sp.]
MKVKLSTRLILSVALPATLLFVGVLWFSSQRAVQRVIAGTEEQSKVTARYYAARLDAELSKVSKVPEMIALEVESLRFESESEIEAYLRHVVAGNPEIFGSCIAFEPGAFTPGKHFYAPYFYLHEGRPEFVQLGNPEYNYFNWEWYERPKQTDRRIWTEPYFDDGGGNAVMTTRSVPFHRNGAFWGVATIDIALTQLTKDAAAIEVANTGYAFIVSAKGRYVAFPDRAQIMKGSLTDSNPELARRMMSGEDGFRKTREPWRGEEAWIAFAPVQSGGFSLALVYPRREVLAQAAEFQFEQRAIAAIGILVLLGALYFGARSISRPITQLAAAAQQVAKGNLDHRLEIDAPLEEVRHLTYAFNKMTRDLQMRMQELRYTTTVKERYEGELNAARQIQMSLLPKRFPPFPERREFDIHAMVRPVREVGGDFYDFYLLEDDWLCFFVGDVSGKGVPAALFMAVTKTLLKASSSRPGAGAEMLSKVNNELCAQTDGGMFVTLCYALLDLRTGALEIGNAGHYSPICLHANGTVEAMETHSNVALGASTNLEYKVSTGQLAPGDALFLFTDGVTEALSREGAFYGAARLQIVLRDLATLPVEKVTRGVIQDVRAFCADREQSDDISVLAVRWRGPTLLN